MLAYNVARRTREIGVRMALGARRSDVQRMIVRQGLGLALAGCVVGLGAAMGLVRIISKMLYGVTAADPATMLATATMLVVVALLASWVPARRATKVDPMIALRAE
jgi:ABC-type antimicrobial peptide transport system permease subunit